MYSSMLLAETSFKMSQKLETLITTKKLMIFPRIPGSCWCCGGERKQHISSSDFFAWLFVLHSCNVCAHVVPEHGSRMSAF